jgi:hypothetical protein
MAELARAHATYRFVILDEEEELPRILVRTSHEVFTRISALLNPPSTKCLTIDVALQTEYASVLQG